MAETVEWADVCALEHVPGDGGVCVLVDDVQIALFRVANGEAVYAVQNRCPHWNEMVLWRGLTGTNGGDGQPHVACPMHKRTFSLASGRCLSEDAAAIETFSVKVVDGRVHVARRSRSAGAPEHASPDPAPGVA